MAPGTGGGEHSQQVDLRGRGRRLRPRICCCRRDSRPQGRHLRHHAYQRCARYEVENWRIARIAKWDFLQAVRQQVARRRPQGVQVWNDPIVMVVIMVVTQVWSCIYLKKKPLALFFFVAIVVIIFNVIIIFIVIQVWSCQAAALKKTAVAGTLSLS